MLLWACDAQNNRDHWYPLTMKKAGCEDGEAIDHSTTITDVAWAPCVGRSFHLVASCSRDGSLLINKLYPADQVRTSKSEFFLEAIIP